MADGPRDARRTLLWRAKTSERWRQAPSPTKRDVGMGAWSARGVVIIATGEVLEASTDAAGTARSRKRGHVHALAALVARQGRKSAASGAGEGRAVAQQ